MHRKNHSLAVIPTYRLLNENNIFKNFEKPENHHARINYRILIF